MSRIKNVLGSGQSPSILPRSKQHRSSLTTSWFVEPSASSRISRYSVDASETRNRFSSTDIGGDELSSLDFFPVLKKGRYSRNFTSSMEQIPQSVQDSSNHIYRGQFRRESGSTCLPGEFCARQQAVLLENPENETRWYFKYFLGKVHHNYLCYDSDKTPFFLSVVASEGIYRAILWRKTGNKRLCLKLPPSGKLPPPKAILEKFSVTKHDKTIKEITSATLQKDFLTLEEQEGAVNFKFGVLYATAGQAGDDEMFSNKEGTSEFRQFLDLLGDTIDLLGWAHYKGGLDVKNNATGSQSLYTVFEGHEIMFHVSTMLPYSEENKQQLERKRHIGNDIVVIIFVDGEDTKAREAAMRFFPSCIKSHFNHIFALVSYNHDKNSYNLVMYSNNSVPDFGPPLPPLGEFTNHQDFRDFLLTKLINAEKAAYRTPTFAHKRDRTLGQLLKEVEHKCLSDAKKVSLGAQLSSSSSSSPSTHRKYQELEQSFTEVGQKLKVEKILQGHHPTSQRTTSLRRDPWQTTMIFEHFPYKIACGDSCGDGTYIISTVNDGTFMLFSDGTMSLIIDKSVPIAQLTVADGHQLLVFRSGYTRESNYLYAIPLETFYMEKIVSGNKASLSSYAIPSSKGCHLYCTTPTEEKFLRVAVAVKTKVTILVWKLPSQSSGVAPLTPLSAMTGSVADSFVKTRELSLPEVPAMMNLLDERPAGKLCFSYHKGASISAIDEITAEVHRLTSMEPFKAKVLSMAGQYHDGKSELLVGRQTSCQVLMLQEGMVFSSPEITLNSQPKEVALIPPYIMAFTEDTIEIRIAFNGSLIQNLHVPNLRLLSKKGDIVFTSTAYVSHCQGRNSSGSLPSGKILGDRHRLSDSVHIYSMCSDQFLGRKSSLASLRSREGNEDTSSTGSQSSISDEPRLFDREHISMDSGVEPRQRSKESLLESMSKGRRYSHTASGQKEVKGRPISDPRKLTSGKVRRQILVIPSGGSAQNLLPLKRLNHSMPHLDIESSEAPHLVLSTCSSPDSGVHDDFSSLSNGKLIGVQNSLSNSFPHLNQL